MFENFFADPKTLLLGGLTGLAFGFLLQKGNVTRFKIIAGQFLMKDFTVLKVMLTAIVVGAIGIYGMRLTGILEAGDMHIKNATLLGNALGGLIFGVGMAVLGYCPGTAVAAIGDGSRHAIAGVVGMVAGAAVYAEVYPWMKSHVLGIGDYQKATLASATGVSPWWFIAALVIIAVGVFLALELGKPRQPRLT
jgi:hypothetical protein